MEIIVIDPFKDTIPHFQEIGLITAYKSVIWDVQLYGLGAFDLVVPATNENMTLLGLDRFLCRAEDVTTSTSTKYYNNAMVIRNVDLQWNPDEGYMLHVTGYSLKDVLNQRIIWDQITASNIRLPALISRVLLENVVDPLQHITDIMLELDAEVDEQTDIERQALDDYNAAVAQYGADSPEAKAAKEIYDEELAKLEDLQRRLANEVENYENQLGRPIPYTSAAIIDYPEDVPVITDIQLHGETIGEWIASICEENRFGWEIQLTQTTYSVKFVIGEDKSDSVIFSPDNDNLINSISHWTSEGYHNSGQVGGEGEGTAQYRVNVGTRAGYARYEMYVDGSGVSENAGEISRSKYLNMLKQYGVTQIIPYLKWKSVEAEIDPNGIFKVGTDFSLGDIVKVDTERGLNADVRLVELIYADEEMGTSVTATFEEVED